MRDRKGVDLRRLRRERKALVFYLLEQLEISHLLCFDPKPDVPPHAPLADRLPLSSRQVQALDVERLLACARTREVVDISRMLAQFLYRDASLVSAAQRQELKRLSAQRFHDPVCDFILEIVRSGFQLVGKVTHDSQMGKYLRTLAVTDRGDDEVDEEDGDENADVLSVLT
eukprot:CAMPEP_0113912324 /NCGR_PEP_ID=MMETSP0780_2-20120614/28864_1 /TAXON_ID=652834 /ORGANISM="Palpitomonas bilix" /LENGTH=170 /DNA_ID=CAMNT_0000909271 /DNA_START=95 /DNA_END=603 /DNA_ORIENTATION=- /assembly_acc=CAM_ASM_000599